MFKYAKLFFSISIFLLTGCGEEAKRIAPKVKKAEKQHSLFNLQRIFSPLEKEVSFPVWFDEMIIAENGIQEITRSIYPLNETDSTAIYPKEKWVYQFDKEGKIKQVNIAHFYENTKTDEVSISYKKGADEFGFSEAKVNEKKGRIINTLQQHKKESYDENFLIYENVSSGDYLFYVIEPKYSGVVSIDQMLSPTVQDIVGIGNPMEIQQRFILKNKVEQHDKVDFQYDSKHLEKIKLDQRPFSTSRYIHYDNEGHCSGFTDSTFSGKKYLSCVTTTLTKKQGILPLRVIHSSESSSANGINNRLEVFDYLIKQK